MKVSEVFSTCDESNSKKLGLISPILSIAPRYCRNLNINLASYDGTVNDIIGCVVFAVVLHVTQL